MTRYGMFVELPNLVEGLIKIDSLPGENFEFDPRKFIYFGRTTGKVYRLGDKIKIKVVNADKNLRTINFEVVEDTQNKVRKIGKFDR